MPGRIAISVWTVINLAAVIAMLVAAASIARLRLTETRGLLFLAMCLGLAPLQTGVSTANPSILGIALSIVGLWLAENRRDAAAGILTGMTICIKLPIGICFFFFYLISRRWKVVIVGTGLAAVIGAVAIRNLWWSIGLSWLSSYRQLTQQMFSPGSINDYTQANPVWYQMVNLQGPLYALMESAKAVNFWAIGLSMSLITVWVRRRMIAPRNRPLNLLAISTLIVISLLPVYHRFYDASVLVLPLAWTVSQFERVRPRLTLLIMALIAPFFIPGATLLGKLSMHMDLAPG